MEPEIMQGGIVNISYQNSEGGVYLNEDKKDESKTEWTHEHLSEEDVKSERRQFYTSFVLGWICISLSSSVQLTLLNSITSLLAEDNLGMTSLAIGSAFQFITTSLLIAFITKLFGVKRTLILSMTITVLFSAAFFYPVLPLFIPASSLMGIGLSILLCNSYVFSNSLGLWYHKFSGGNIDNILFLISGLTSAALGSGFLWGNIIYYEILDTGAAISSNASNVTFICGASYCNEDLGNSTVAASLPVHKIHTLIGVFTGIALLALVLFLFVIDPMTKLNSSPGKLSDFCIILKETYGLLKNPKCFLLILITIFIGMEEQFIVAVFTYAFVTCSLGVSKVGFIMLSFGIAQIVTPVLQWPIMKYCGRPVVLILFYLIFLGEILAMLFLKPSGDDALTYYIITVIYGAADTMVIAAVFSTYAVLFDKTIESGFSLCNVWYSIGSFIGNTLSPFICVYVKLYMLMVLMTLGVALHLFLEYILYRNKNKN